MRLVIKSTQIPENINAKPSRGKQNIIKPMINSYKHICSSNAQASSVFTVFSASTLILHPGATLMLTISSLLNICVGGVPQPAELMFNGFAAESHYCPVVTRH